jgi:hypothetical protein
VKDFINKFDFVNLDNSRGDIRDMLPELVRKGKMVRQTRYDFSHSIKEYNREIVSGFPYKNTDRHFKLMRKCGEKDGNFIGVMDDNTPVRLKQDQSERMSNEPDRVWFALMPTFLNINSTKIFSSTPDKYGYCAYDLKSAEATFTWFSVSKCLVGKYPTWANQYDLWQPNISEDLKEEWFALCYAFGLAENRCVVTKFEKDNPIEGVPEVWVDNPMSPNNQESFYRTTLQKEIKKSKSIHGDIYDYDKTVYKTYTDKVIITCKKHGDFSQKVSKHFEGHKCKKCVNESYKLDFINICKSKYVGYSYDKTIYTGIYDNVIITCDKHGDFTTKAAYFLYKER